MASRTLSDHLGRPITLGVKLGEGGEGAVYTVSGGDTVAKLYLKPIPDFQARKLDAMATGADAELKAIAAWPLGVVYERGKAVGFTMPRLPNDIHELHDLTGPKSRKRLYPNANWRFLIHSGVNIARAFQVLHSRQIVMGDVNSANIVVRTDSTTRLIDCDSFQMRSGSTLYPCLVGVPEYQPPELHGVDLSKIERLPQHDLFGLAVIMFELIFVGRHPFAGRILRNTADNSIEANIAAHRFFYAPDAASKGLQPPPGTPTLAAVTPDIARMFVSAFTGPPAQRPSAANWHAAMSDLESKIETCPVNSAHKNLKGQPCPWCALERAGTTAYFMLPIPTTQTGAVDTSIWKSFTNADVERAWAQITAIAPPAPVDPTITIPKYHRTPLHLWTRQRLWIAAAITVGIAAAFGACSQLHAVGGEWIDALAALIAWFYVRPDARVVTTERRLARDEAKIAFDQANAHWIEVAQNKPFTEALARLTKVKQDLATQQQRYDAEKRTMEQNRRREEHDKWMDSHVIGNSKIRLIGPKMAAVLRSYGVETAADITYARVINVPGIGDTKAQSLVSWAATVDRSFRFDPNKGLDPAVLADFEGRHARERLTNRGELLNGVTVLTGIRDRIINSRGPAETRVREAAEQYGKALADANVPILFYRC